MLHTLNLYTRCDKVPRPFGPALHGTKPNDILQFDYIDIGRSHGGAKYILMLRNDHSDYKWFFATTGTTADNAAIAIIDWFASLGVPHGLISDVPTHFRNETLRLVGKSLRLPHHVTLPYTPWSKGAVQRLGKEVDRTFRALLSELQMLFKEWSDLLPVIQSILNNAPSSNRRIVSPLTAFSGMEPSPSMAPFSRTTTLATMSINKALMERSVNFMALKERVSELQPLVQSAVSNNSASSHNRASNGQLPNFSRGDFVVVAREEFHPGEKLALRWREPRRSTKTLSAYVFQIEDHRNGSMDAVHGCRVQFCHDPSLDKEKIMSHVISSETGMPLSQLLKLVDKKKGPHFLVRSKGLENSEDSLEPLAQIYSDVSKMLLRLLRRTSITFLLAKRAKQELFL